MVFVLIPGVPKVAGWFELFFVNAIGLPYNSGLLFFLIVLDCMHLYMGIRYSLKNRTGDTELCHYSLNCNYDRIFILCHDHDQVISKTANESE